MSEALFLRLLSYEDKSSMLAKVIEDSQTGHAWYSIIHIVDPALFDQVPGSTFAYWVSNSVLRLFAKLPKLESEERSIRVGLQTSDDLRFVRLWWEVSPQKTNIGTIETTSEQYRQQTFKGKQWIPLAKGGAYSPYYSDIHLVVNWKRDAEDLKSYKDSQTGKAFSYLRNADFYFRRGLTWTSRTTSEISIRILPKGCIFSHKGPAVFADAKDLKYLLALMNSQVFETLVILQLGAADAAARSYEVGLIQKVPIPDFSEPEGVRLRELAMSCVDLKRTLDTANETTHVFYLPMLLQVTGKTLAQRCAAWQTTVYDTQQQLANYQHEIDDIAFRLYGIDDRDRRAIEEALGRNKQAEINKADEVDTEEEEEDGSETSINTHSLVVSLLFYTVGCAYGRWDVRFATHEQPIPELPDPFAPLPACSPGMLTGNDGLPLYEVPPTYPLIISREGILVDDLGHPDDIVRRVQDVLGVIWQDNAEAIEQEVCQLLGVKELRDYFRRPGNDGFWMDHVKRYSKSRRKAPIYWLLQSSKRNYALWLYYHRLDKDILFKALTNYVEPKLRLEEGRLAQLRTQLVGAGSAGREVKQLEKQLERQESLMAELYDFRDKLRRAADLQLAPDLNDGVVLNIAPLWELVPWSEARKYWEELRAGKYEWSSISKQLRERKVI